MAVHCFKQWALLQSFRCLTVYFYSSGVNVSTFYQTLHFERYRFCVLCVHLSLSVLYVLKSCCCFFLFAAFLILSLKQQTNKRRKALPCAWQLPLLCPAPHTGVEGDFEAWKTSLWPKLKRALDGRKVKSCSGDTCSKKCGTCSSKGQEGKGQGEGEGHHHGDKCSSEEEDEVEWEVLDPSRMCMGSEGWGEMRWCF